jgi:hypothetical protein
MPRGRGSLWCGTAALGRSADIRWLDGSERSDPKLTFDAQELPPQSCQTEASALTR